MTTTDDRRERDDLLEALATHRGFLRQTVRGVSDEDARRRTTVSELCLGGLIKHVGIVEEHWASFIVEGPPAVAIVGGEAASEHADGFEMHDDETLAALLDRYEEVATRTDALVGSLVSLDASQPLPEAPWFPPGARWSARRVLLHVIAETAQHAGHSDILRECLDGTKTMG
jgi:hypothetical protein